MRTFALGFVIGLLALIGVRAVPLDWGNPSTNNAFATWFAWTNGPVLRYSLFWTPQTNTDTGTNWTTTTNWNQFADVNSSTTNVVIPTNVVFGSRITYVITLPGGLKTTPIIPILFTNWLGFTITNQPQVP